MMSTKPTLWGGVFGCIIKWMRKKRGKKSSAKVQMPSDQVLWLAAVAMLAVLSLAYALLNQWAIIKVPAAVIESEIVAMTNDERTANSVGQLTENTLLDQAAQAKADDMAAKGYFSHTGPDGKTPWQWVAGAGYVYQYAGENLAVRFTDSSEVINAWMASPTHRANIVKPQYTQIGVGIADGTYEGAPATFVVQYFGTPVQAAASKVPESIATSGYGDLPAGKSPEVGSSSLAKPPAVTTLPSTSAVEGAQASAPDTIEAPSWWDRVVAFVATALNSLTASVAEAEPVVIGADGVSTAH